MSLIQPTAMTTIVTTDLIGVTRGRSFPTDELESYQQAGVGWVPANSALTPQDRVAENNPWGSFGDLRLVPDMNTRVQVPNGPDTDAPALDFIHADICETDGQPWAACPRTLLRNEIQRYRDELGLEVTAAFEHEFNLGYNDPGIAHHAFSLSAQHHAASFGGWLLSALKAAGVEPEMFLPEYGKAQYEVTCRPTQGVAAADRAVNVREITREIARQMGLDISFSPKLEADGVSNGVHLHISLQDPAGNAVMYDAQSSNGLSEKGLQWAAGVLKFLPALCAFSAPTPVSYLRLKPHHWSASYANLGQRNREAALRICPTITLGGKSPAKQYNLEFRPLDATASPHLSMATVLIAGRLGLQQKLTLHSSSDEDPESMSDEQRQARHILALPDTLEDALASLRNNPQLLEQLPPLMMDAYFALKAEELKSTEKLTPAELCDHYARLY